MDGALAIEGPAGAIPLTLLPSSTSEDVPDQRGEDHCHCCPLECCCREPDIWGPDYCSCGLPKRMCNGVHRCMQVLEEEGIGPEMEAWEAYSRATSRRKDRTWYHEPPAHSPWEEESRGSGEDASGQEDACTCSTGLGEASSRCTCPEFERDLRSVREWWAKALSLAWIRSGDWKEGGERGDEESTCSGECGSEEEEETSF